MTILMWISRWQNEMELMIMGLQIILFLFLTIGGILYCAATEKSKPVQKTPGIVLKNTWTSRKRKKKKVYHRRTCKIKIYMRMRKKPHNFNCFAEIFP